MGPIKNKPSKIKMLASKKIPLSIGIVVEYDVTTIYEKRTHNSESRMIIKTSPIIFDNEEIFIDIDKHIYGIDKDNHISFEDIVFIHDNNDRYRNKTAAYNTKFGKQNIEDIIVAELHGTNTIQGKNAKISERLLGDVPDKVMADGGQFGDNTYNNF